MIFTRLGYLIIVAIIAVAAIAVAVVLWPSSSSGEPELTFDEVVNFARFGVVERIEVEGDELTVTLYDWFDPQESLDTDAHVFVSTAPEGGDVAGALAAAGVPVNGDGALQVVVVP